MERDKYTFLVAIFLMGGSLVVAQEVLTLDKALKIAFENSPALVQSKLSLRQNELNLQAQKASLKSQYSLDVNPFSYSRSSRYASYNSKWYDSKGMSFFASLGIV